MKPERRYVALAAAFLLAACTGRASPPPAKLWPRDPQGSSCGISCEIDGKQRSFSVSCHPGFQAVCRCEQVPRAYCEPSTSPQ